MARYRKFASLVLILCLTAGLAAARTKLKPGWNLFSKSQDIELGRQVATQAERQLSLVNDPALNNYVSGLGRKLARYAPDSDYPFTFKVVRDKKINAFALPGGPIYVHTGTIEAAGNEAQLAGVIAHEMGHVVLRHATNNVSKAYAYQVPLAILGGALGSGGIGSQIAGLVGSFGLNSIFLKYSRDAERQADILGTQILYDAGYEPDQMALFFEKLERQEKSRSIGWLSSHPNPGNRVELVRNEIRTLGPPQSRPIDHTQFARAHSLAADWDRRAGADRPETVYGHEPNGDHRHPSSPSSRFRTYQGRDFRIAYPENWEVFGSEGAVTIAPREGISQNAIAYGALISVYDPYETDQGRVTLGEATSQLITQLRESNPGMRTISDSRRRVRLEGGAAESVTLMGRSPVRGENEIDWLVAAQRPDGSLWYVVFIAPERDFGTMRPTFERMLDSLQLVN